MRWAVPLAHGRRHIIIAAMVAVVTVAVYAPVARFDFVNFDDPEYVTGNPHVRDGLSLAGVVWAFTTAHAANWHPITWLSHMLDCQVFGLAPRGHHLMNVALHTTNALLFLLFLYRTTREIWPSMLATSLFALHPLRVESVAWIAERKDVLSAFFFLLSLLSYVRYTRQPTRGRYLVVAIAFALALMAKAMVVTLPLVLLLIDYWPLRRKRRPGSRVPSPGFQNSGPRTRDPGPWSSVLIEKIPLSALAVAVSVITYVVQRDAGAVLSSQALPLSARVGNALAGYGWYLHKTVWPSGLAVFYPMPAALSVASIVTALAIVSALTAIAVRLRATRPYVLVGWLWFVVTLLPVIGLIKAGEQSTADRFTYIPHMGLCIAVVWVARDLAVASTLRRVTVATVGVVAVAACIVVTMHQLAYWRDGTSLFQHALAVTADNHVAHLNLGQILMADSRPAEALEHFNEAVRLRPEWARARLHLAAALTAVGDAAAATHEYEAALGLEPGDAMAHFNLGLLRAAAGATDAAIVEYQRALEADPNYVRSHLSMGIAFAAQGRRDEAIAAYERALQLDPRSVVAHTNLAIVLEDAGRRTEAIAHYTAAAAAAPNDPRVAFNLGTALEQAGQRADALRRYRDAAAAQPDFAPARLAIGNLLAENGDRAGAANEICAALAAQPGWAEAEAALAALSPPAEDHSAPE